VWLLPVLMIMGSGKTTGGEKFAWLLAVFFVSWFAWVFYMLVAPIKNKN
jgi:small neutral amino acid transporter SnatA (MarC family)